MQKKKKTDEESAELRYRGLIEKRNELNAQAREIADARDTLNQERREILEEMRALRDERKALVNKMREHKKARNLYQQRARELIEVKRGKRKDIHPGLERELAGLRDGLADLKGSDPEGVVEVAKLLERKMAIYHNGLRKASDYVSPRLRISLLAAMDTVDGVSITSMAVIVEKHLAGDEQAPRRVVVSKFEERLRVAEEKLGALPVADEAEGPAVTSRVRSSLAEAKQLLEKEDYQAALSKIVEVAELTKEAEQEILEEETEAEAAAEEAVMAAAARVKGQDLEEGTGKISWK